MSTERKNINLQLTTEQYELMGSVLIPRESDRHFIRTAIDLEIAKRKDVGKPKGNSFGVYVKEYLGPKLPKGTNLLEYIKAALDEKLSGKSVANPYDELEAFVAKEAGELFPKSTLTPFEWIKNELQRIFENIREERAPKPISGKRRSEEGVVD